METQAAPRPTAGKTGMNRVIYNVIQDLSQATAGGLHKATIWNHMPKQFRKPYCKKRFLKALTNMTYRGFLEHHGDGIYSIATKQHFEARMAHINKRQNQRRKAAKKKAAKPKQNGSGGWKDPVLQRIDKRMLALEHKLAELKSMRTLFEEADL